MGKIRKDLAGSREAVLYVHCLDTNSSAEACTVSELATLQQVGNEEMNP